MLNFCYTFDYHKGPSMLRAAKALNSVTMQADPVDFRKRVNNYCVIIAKEQQLGVELFSSVKFRECSDDRTF